MCREQLNPLPQLPNVKQARTCFAEVYVSLQLQPFSSALLFPSTTVYVFSDHFPQICLHLSSLSFTDKKSSISSSSAINFSVISRAWNTSQSSTAFKFNWFLYSQIISYNQTWCEFLWEPNGHYVSVWSTTIYHYNSCHVRYVWHHWGPRKFIWCGRQD